MVSFNLISSVFMLLLSASANAKATPFIEVRTPGQSPRPPSYCNNAGQLLSVLYSKRLQPFCKQYINHKPGNVRKVTKTVTATTCANKNLRCTPTTITPVVSRTATRTITISIHGEPVSEYSTITSLVTVETTVIRPILTVTTTYTVGTPRNGLEKRHYKPKLPACISQCVPNKISSACSSLVIPVSTVTKTRTIQGKVRTVTARPRTTTITQTKSVTFTIPGETTTVVITAPEETATVTRTEDVTVTVTTSVCPSRTPEAWAIGIVNQGPDTGLYAPVAASNEVECCSACYDNRGCFGWLWSGSCTYVYSEEHSLDPNRSCPVSLTLILIAGDGGDGAGGRGPCFRN